MKTTHIGLIPAALLTAAALFSCTRDIDIPQEEEPGDSVSVVVNVVGEEAPATRSAFAADTLSSGEIVTATDTCSLTVTEQEWPVSLEETATRGNVISSLASENSSSMLCCIDFQSASAWSIAYSNRTFSKVTDQSKFISNDRYVLAGPRKFRFLLLWPGNGITLDTGHKTKWGPATTVSQQKDLLYACEQLDAPSGGLISHVDATLRHALCQVKVVTNTTSPAITVSSVTFRGVRSNGTFDAVTGDFSLSDDTDSYTIAGGTMTADRTNDITAGSKTFLLLPQTVPSGAELEVKFSFDGEDRTLTMPITGHNWAKGKIVTYILGFDKARASIKFDKKVYSVSPRKSVSSEIIYRYDAARTYSAGAAPGATGSAWSVTPPSALPHTTSSTTNKLDYTYTAATDNVTWTPTKYAIPGSYPISCRTNDGNHSDDAVLVVNDTRWINTDKANGTTGNVFITSASTSTNGYFYYAFGDLSCYDHDSYTTSSKNYMYYAGNKIAQTSYSDHIGYRWIDNPDNKASFTASCNYSRLAWNLSSCSARVIRGEVYWKDTWDEAAQEYRLSAPVTIIVTNASQVLMISPERSYIGVGGSQQLTATLWTRSGSTLTSPVDVTGQCTWSISSGSCATVSSGGLVSGSSKGKVTVHAVYGSTACVSDATVVVGDDYDYEYELKVTPASQEVYVGGTCTYRAELTTKTLSNGVVIDSQTADVTSRATWTSSDTSVGTVSGGSATGLKKGTSTITAAYDGMSATATLNVKNVPVSYMEELVVTPASATKKVGETQQFVATFYTYYYVNGVRDDSQTQSQVVTASATWTSGSTSVAQMQSTKGLAKGVAVGTSTITATYNGKSGSATFIVAAADPVVTHEYELKVTPASATKKVGETQQFVATYYTYTLYDGVRNDSETTSQVVTASATWTSGSTSVAQMQSTKGLAKGVAVGTSTITATYNGKSGSATFIVSMADPVITYGHELVLDGPAVTVKVGRKATVVRTAKFWTITYADGVETGRTYETVTATLVTDNAAIATVDNATAKVSGVAEGNTTLHGTYVYGGTTYTSTNTIAVTVKPDSGWGVDDDDDSGSGSGESGEYKHDN